MIQRELRLDSRRSKESDKAAIEQVLFNAKRIVGGDTPVFESFASFTASNWAIKWETCPQQQSDYDCGISVLASAAFHAAGYKMPFSLNYDLWRRLLLTIVLGEKFLLPELRGLPEFYRSSLSEFPPIDAANALIQMLQDYLAKKII